MPLSAALPNHRRNNPSGQIFTSHEEASTTANKMKPAREETTTGTVFEMGTPLLSLSSSDSKGERCDG